MTTQTELFVEERLFIGGQLRDAAGGRTYQNINPATEEVIGVAADATAEDMGGQRSGRLEPPSMKVSGPPTRRSGPAAYVSCTQRCCDMARRYGPRSAQRSGPPKRASIRHSSTARWTTSRTPPTFASVTSSSRISEPVSRWG